MISVGLLLLLWLVPPLATHAALPNLPSSATVLLDCPFNSVGNPICNGQVANFYNAGSIESVVSAPESPPNVYRYSRSAGSPVGVQRSDAVQVQSQGNRFWSNGQHAVGVMLDGSTRYAP